MSSGTPDSSSRSIACGKAHEKTPAWQLRNPLESRVLRALSLPVSTHAIISSVRKTSAPKPDDQPLSKPIVSNKKAYGPEASRSTPKHDTPKKRRCGMQPGMPLNKWPCSRPTRIRQAPSVTLRLRIPSPDQHRKLSRLCILQMCLQVTKDVHLVPYDVLHAASRVAHPNP